MKILSIYFFYHLNYSTVPENGMQRNSQNAQLNVTTLEYQISPPPPRLLKFSNFSNPAALIPTPRLLIFRNVS